jgi:hypothetical protein
VIGILVLAAGLRYAVRFPWMDTWTTLASADWGLLAAAAAANLFSLACKAWAWQLLLRPVAPVRARTAQAATFAGAAVGSIGVAMSGEATRLHLVSQWDGLGASMAARSIAASRVVEAAALGVFIVGLVGGVAGAAGTGGADLWRLAAGAAAVVVAALAVLRWLPWLRPLGSGADPAAGWTARQLVAPLALGVASWGFQWATYHWSIAATHAAVTPSASALALLLSNLGGIFRLTPGNVGIVQGAVVLGLAPAGVPASRAVAAGLALQAVQVLPVLLIGVGILGRRRVRRTLPSRSAEVA